MIYQILRLCQQRSLMQNKRFLRIRPEKGHLTKEEKDFNKLLLEHKEKITFSSFLDQDKLRMGYFKYYLTTIKKAKRAEAKELADKSLPPLPVALRYSVDRHRLLDDPGDGQEQNGKPRPTVFQLPFASTTQVDITEDKVSNSSCASDANTQQLQDKDNLHTSNTATISQKGETINSSRIIDSTTHTDKSQTDDAPSKSQNHKDTKHQEAKDSRRSELNRSGPDIKNWMTSYEYFDDSKLLDEEDDDEKMWSKQYGTPDPSAGISSVGCCGCGALLHCSDPAIPGYLPSEIFKGRSNEQLRSMECQRCHFLTEYNIALDVTVQPHEYEQLLESIRHVKSLVVVMVDLLDFPCSVWPGIVDIVGTDRPIILVGNKVDLIPGDSHGYLKRVRQSLLTEIGKTKLAEANIKHVGLISAKTGYGVEELISAMFKYWLYKGHVFLVGCTNVGKSSLFNALLQSDYCKVAAVDIVKRATVSRWPGTTLNLLKFPINRPSGWKIYQRTKRLQSEAKLMKMEKEIRKGQLQEKAPTEAPALIGHIGRTFSDERNRDYIENTDKLQPLKLDANEEAFSESKWVYDTPGVVHPDQALSLLSTEELLRAVPRQLLRPQTYYLRHGQSVLIGGLARVDLVACPEAARLTIFCSDGLPITVTNTDDADEVYDKFLGTELLAVPTGGSERLKKWPGLKRREDLLEFEGEGPKLCCGDIVLSSVAWVGVTAKKGSVCKVAAWTPEGRGIHKRTLSLLPYAVNLKGKRLRDTPAYMIGKVFSDEA